MKYWNFYFIFVCCFFFSNAIDEVNETISDNMVSFIPPGSYSYTTNTMKKYSSTYRWEQVQVQINNYDVHYSSVMKLLPRISRLNVASMNITLPVYVSFTTMAMRIHKVSRNIYILLEGYIRPTHIFLFISRESYLLDEGVHDLPQELLFLSAAGFVTIVFTKNIGPHRKLLPILHRFWRKDCFLVTVDDDLHQDAGSKLIYRLLKYYQISKVKGVVALRVRRIGICSTLPHTVTRYYAWTVLPSYNRNEMLVVPTGTGGILYKPSYFKKIIFVDKFREFTGTADDLMFRLGTLMNNIEVTVGCADMWWRGRLIRPCKPDAFDIKFEKNHPSSSDYPLEESLIRNSLRLDVAPLKFITSLNHHHHHHHEISNISSSSSSSSSSSLIIINEQQRRLENKKVKSLINPDRYMPKGSAKELFAINRRGANDIAWKTAVAFLSHTKYLNLQKLIENHYNERDDFCYRSNLSVRISRYCSMYWCREKDGEPILGILGNRTLSRTNNVTKTI